MVLQAERDVVAGLQTGGPEAAATAVGRGVELGVGDDLAGAGHDVRGLVGVGGGVLSGVHGSERSGRYVRDVDPVARFTQLVSTANPPLDECALLIAATRSRRVDVDEQLAVLDALAADCPGIHVERALAATCSASSASTATPATTTPTTTATSMRSWLAGPESRSRSASCSRK